MPLSRSETRQLGDSVQVQDSRAGSLKERRAVQGSNVGVEVLLLKTAIVCRKAHGVAGIYGLGFALSTSGYVGYTTTFLSALLTRGSRRKLICELGEVTTWHGATVN